MLVKSVSPVDGLSYSVQKSLDPYYGNLAATASLSLLCIFIFLLYVWFFMLLYYPIHSSLLQIAPDLLWKFLLHC